MNKTATYIAARVARQIADDYNRQSWLEHKPEIMRVLTDIQPSKPEDGIAGFLAYEVQGHDRMKMRTGRFLTRKLKLNDDFLPDTAIQAISAQINVHLFGNIDEIRLDSGKQITRNYENSVGGSSCMSGGDADYTGLYADNPDKIKQLIMVSINDTARAIVHVLDNGQYHMSRVYATSEDLKQRMYAYADNEGWLRYGDTIDDRNILIVSGLDYTEGEIPYADSLTGYRINSDGLTMVHSSLRCEGTLDSTCGELGNNYECCNCGENVGENVGEDDVYSGDGDTYCFDCYCEIFTQCDHCDGVYHHDSVIWIESTEHNVCDFCLEKYYSRCEDCEDYFDNDKMYSIDNGDYVCESCLENYTCCEDCGDYFSGENTTYIDEWSMTFCDDYLDEIIKSYAKKECEGQLLLPTQ